MVSKGTTKINNECGKMIVAGKLFILSMYRDQRELAILT
jgi:hypothetical protein